MPVSDLTPWDWYSALYGPQGAGGLEGDVLPPQRALPGYGMGAGASPSAADFNVNVLGFNQPQVGVRQPLQLPGAQPRMPIGSTITPGVQSGVPSGVPRNVAGLPPYVGPGGQMDILNPQGAGGIARVTPGGQDLSYYGGTPPFQRGMGDTVGGSSFNPLSLIGGGNPYIRGALAATGALAPTPAGAPIDQFGNEISPLQARALPMHPSSTGAWPMQGGGGLPMHPSSIGAMPQGNPSATPTPASGYGAPTQPARPYTPTPSSQGGSTQPARPYTPTPKPSPAATATRDPAGRFTTLQWQVPGSGRGPNAPIYTALDLGSLFR